MWVWVSVVVVTRNARGNNVTKVSGMDYRGEKSKVAGVLATRFFQIRKLN